MLEFLVPNIVLAQEIKADSSSQQVAFNAPRTFFNKGIKQQSWLYNGPAYDGAQPRISGSPYFNTEAGFTSGTLRYDGFVYQSIPLKYDIYEDKLVSVLANGISMFSLIPEKVSDFYLYQHHFKYIKADDALLNSPLKSGYYDMIYEGKIKLLAKREARVQSTTSNFGFENFFVQKTNYFLEKDNTYYRISNESSFLKLFKEKRAELKQHLKAQKVKFKKDPEQAMKILVAHYESLPN